MSISFEDAMAPAGGAPASAAPPPSAAPSGGGGISFEDAMAPPAPLDNPMRGAQMDTSAPPPAAPSATRIIRPVGGDAGMQAAVRGVDPSLMNSFTEASRTYGVPLDMLIAQARQESGLNPKALGKSGERGLMQVMPSTALSPGFGVDGVNPDTLWDPHTNIMFGAKYLAARARSQGLDLSDPTQAARALGNYNGGGDPDYAQHVMSRIGVNAPAGGGGPSPQQSFADARPVGAGQDMAESLGTGLQKGAASILGMPSDLWHMLDQGYQHGVARAAQALGLLSPEEAQSITQGMPGEASSISSAAINKDIQSGDQALGTDQHTPQTTGGKFAETAGEFMPGAVAFGAQLNPGEALPTARQATSAAVRYGAIPGVASEGAGQLTEGTPLEPYARAAGAVAGGLAASPGIATSMLPMPKSPLARSLSGVTDQQFQQAQTLLDTSRASGAPLTLPEALQQVTNGATGLGAVQRFVEQSPEGGAAMRQFYAQRPGQTDALGRGAIDQIASAGAVAPSDVAPRVQGAAENVIQGERNTTNQMSQAAYNATANNPNALVPQQAFAQVKTPAIEKALAAVKSDPIKYGDLSKLPDNSMPVLDAAQKYLGDVAEAAKRSGENFAASNATKAANDLTGIMDTAFPRYASARNIQATRQAAVEEPLRQSPTGQLADASTFDQQSKVLFNSSPLPGSDKAVGDAVRSISKSDPEAAQQMVRLYVERTFNEATQRAQSGANQFAGAKFAAVINGNPQQAANLQAAITALPNGTTRYAAMKNALTIMEAQGQRMPAGSPTAFNQMMKDDLSGGTGKAMELAKSAANPWEASSFLSKAYQQFRLGKNTAAFADLFTTGSISELRDIAKLGPRSANAQRALAWSLIPRLAGNASKGIATMTVHPGDDQSQQ